MFVKNITMYESLGTKE